MKNNYNYINNIINLPLSEAQNIVSLLEKNNISYSEFINYIIDLELSEEVAKNILLESIEHWKDISLKLQRDCGIRVAIFDYVFNIKKSLKNPVIVENNYPVKRCKNYFNFKIFMNILQKEIKRAERYKLKFSILLIQLNNSIYYKEEKFRFETIEILGMFIRNEDLITIYKDNIFMIFLPQTNKIGAKSFAKRIINRLYETYSNLFPPPVFTVSYVSYPDNGDNINNLLYVAENQLETYYKNSNHNLSVFISQQEINDKLQTFKEKRNFMRYKLNNYNNIEFFDDNKNFIAKGTIENISANGILIRCDCKIVNTVPFINRNMSLKIIKIGNENFDDYILTGVVKRIYHLNEKNHVYVALQLDQIINSKIWEKIESEGNLIVAK